MRKACLPVILLMVPSTAPSQVGESAVSRFNECAAVQNDTERLACFDRVTREVRAAAPPAGPAATRPGRPAATAQAQARQQRDDFGLDAARVRDTARPTQPQKLKRMTARVAAARTFGAGYWAILLEDGAIWEVTELDPAFRPPRRGDTISIRRGALGGYLLYAGNQPSIRVTRVS